MTVYSATQQLDPGSGVGSMMTFPDPAAGAQFSTTVPAGQTWRVWGGSCHITGSATVTPRTPCLWLGTGLPLTGGAFPSGAVYYYVASNGQDYNHDANQTVVFYDQDAFTDGPPWMTGAGETWGFTNNPASLCFNPVGIKAIWLPPGAVVAFYMHNIQVGDQVSQCGLLVEAVTL